MQIIEQTIVPKNPARKSEDGIVATPDFVAVIDGSTSKSRVRCYRDTFLGHHSPGLLAMLTVAATIKTMPADVTCHQFCQAAALAIRRRYIKSLLPHLAQHPEDRLAASAIVYSRLRRELWLIGDCQALVDGTLIDNPKPHEQMLAQERADIIRQTPRPWDSFLIDDTARQTIIPHMLECMQQQNVSYAVLDGFPVAERYVKVIALDFQPHQLVLASDGYPFLCPTLEESEARLAAQHREDPLNIGPAFMATKAFMRGNNSFDDRAYIRFDI